MSCRHHNSKECFLYPKHLTFCILLDTIATMFKIKKSDTFDKWVKRLKDTKGKIAVLRRVERFKDGNFGKSEPVGDGISEAKIDVGPGYRVYYIVKNGDIVVLLVGGTKKQQQRDIDNAKEIAKEY